MNTFSNISAELRAFFSNHKIFKILLPIDMVLLFAGLAFIVLSTIFGIRFGDVITSLAYWSFILGLLLTYANMKEMFLYIGLLGYGVTYALSLLITLIRFGFFSWASLFNALVFGGLGYLVFKRTVSSNPGANVKG